MPGAKIRIRTATEADIPAMHEIRCAVRENRLADPASVQPGDYAPFLGERGRGWVAELDDRVVGFAIGDRVEGNVWALFVAPGFETRGVGRGLHDRMIAWLFAAGLDSVWLGTEPGTRAAAFYAAAGWVLTGSRPNGEVRFEMSREGWLARHTDPDPL